MNSREFELLLSHPEALKSIAKSSLEQLVREYPYFQSAYLLLAKNSQLNNEASFEGKLNLAAAYAIDRRKLYELINGPLKKYEAPIITEKIIPSVATEPVSSTNRDLDELLRSIHERKQRILGTEETLPKEKSAEVINTEETERIFMEELRGSGSEFSPVRMDLNEEPSVNPETSSAELEMMKRLEMEIEDLEDYQRNEELLLLNETAGGGAEYLPASELLSEEAENAFVEEHDPEIDSISVIEEEFILRDLDSDVKEKEVLQVSEIETPLQVEQQNIQPADSITNIELGSSDDSGLQLEEQVAFQEDEIFHMLNENAAKTLNDSEVQNNEHSEIIPNTNQESEQESIIGEKVSSDVYAQEEHADSSSFRINKHVESPGEFLPGKSYSFIGWLQFFKPESQKVPKPKQEIPVIQEESATDEKLIAEEKGIRTGIEKELETIDRIIPMLKHESLGKQEFQLSPADLARKSLEMDEEIVTETLAKIYEVQGLYDKAIRMYAKLSLKYPEKSLFFAARIKELKSKK